MPRKAPRTARNLKLRGTCLALAATLAPVSQPALAQVPKWHDAQPRKAGEGEGPYTRLIITNAMIIRGQGMPAAGPGTIVIEGNRIESIWLWGEPDLTADRVIDAKGRFVVPGLIDTHVRLVDNDFADLPPDYALKLLLAHGVTTIASMVDKGHIDWSLRLAQAAREHRIVAPRVQPWGDISGATPEQARANVRAAHAKGIVGIGEGSVYTGDVPVMKAVLDEARALGMRSDWHMFQDSCARFDALDAARAGLRALAHWYCLPETLLEDRQRLFTPEGYNALKGRERFLYQGTLWSRVARPGSERWNEVLDQLLALDFTLEPTFSVYEANRDYDRASHAPWHARYSHPDLVRTWTPSESNRFAHHFDWTSEYEATWREDYALWMRFVKDYKDRGGRVVAGTDGGYMWATPGFATIRNLEMLREAGFSPQEVLDTATLNSAEQLGLADKIGTIDPGKLADLVILDHNPLDNLKAFYGTGFVGADTDGRLAQQGGVRLVVSDGIVYDAKALLDDVAQMVAQARTETRP